MATTETAICNQALLKMGQQPIDDIDGTDAIEEKCAIIFDETRDETLIDGPKDGWEFAKMTYHDIDRESFTITAFAQATATTTTVTATHTLVAGDKVEISGTTNYDGYYKVESVSTTVSFVITKTFVADDATGTAYWTSDEFRYRYAIPTSLSTLKVMSGGIELTDWKERGSYALTNMESTEVDMLILQAITDVTLFPSYFVKLLVLNLAIELHYNLTQDLNAIQLLERERDRKKPKAIGMDERKKYNREKSTAWVDAGHVSDTLEPINRNN
jgi:hypothetical protein